MSWVLTLYYVVVGNERLSRMLLLGLPLVFRLPRALQDLRRRHREPEAQPMNLRWAKRHGALSGLNTCNSSNLWFMVVVWSNVLNYSRFVLSLQPPLQEASLYIYIRTLLCVVLINMWSRKLHTELWCSHQATCVQLNSPASGVTTLPVCLLYNCSYRFAKGFGSQRCLSDLIRCRSCSESLLLARRGSS